jgi:hypothetical protein
MHTNLETYLAQKWREKILIVRLSTKIFATFSFKNKNFYKILDQNVQIFAKSKKCKVEARTNVEVSKIFERVVGVAGRLEAVQVLHLYAANIGAKMREILIVRLFTKFFGKKTERLEAVQVHLHAVNIAAKMSE